MNDNRYSQPRQAITIQRNPENLKRYLTTFFGMSMRK